MSGRPCLDADYPLLEPYLGAVARGLLCIGQKGVMGHAHRWWEYGSMIQSIGLANCRLGLSVLEIGPGYESPLAPALALNGAKVHCLELNGEFCAAVAAHALLVQEQGGAPITVEQGDAAAIPERLHGQFDAVVSVSVLEHIPDDAAAVAGAAQCLKPGGLLAMTFDLAATPGAVGHAQERLYQPADVHERLIPALAAVGCHPLGPVDYGARLMNVGHYTFGMLACRRDG